MPTSPPEQTEAVCSACSEGCHSAMGQGVDHGLATGRPQADHGGLWLEWELLLHFHILCTRASHLARGTQAGFRLPLECEVYWGGDGGTSAGSQHHRAHTGFTARENASIKLLC